MDGTWTLCGDRGGGDGWFGEGAEAAGEGGGEEGVIRVRCYPPAGVLSAFDAVDEL